MIIEYEPKGVCSKYMKFDVEDGIIRNFEVIGGCHGNLQGIAALLKGMKVEDVIARFEGINCRGKGTSCPDQIAQALKQLNCSC
ncbi:MAG: TIGR03905 family TSCPD domain-containing protein [Proteobacteria bacterium]|nr:TIGR03905 family TSCPD domain-containing protein [Pseudomonadota bacterium]